MSKLAPPLYDALVQHTRRALNSGALVTLDPLVGDQSCQLRAVLLLRLHAQSPLCVPKHILAAFSLLTLTKRTHLNALGACEQPDAGAHEALGQATLLTALLGDGGARLGPSKAQAIRTGKAARRSLGEASVALLQTDLLRLARAAPPAATSPVHALLAALEQALGSGRIEVGSERTPMAPFYVGTLAAVALLRACGHPVVFEVACYGRTGTRLQLLDVALGVLSAGGDELLQVTTVPPVLARQPALVVSLYQARVDGAAVEPPGGYFRAGTCARDALRQLQDFGPLRALLCAAATHPQYAHDAAFADGRAARPSDELTHLEGDARALLPGYHAARALGLRAGIGTHQLLNRPSSKGAPPSLFAQDVALNVDHVFASSYLERRLAAEARLAAAANVALECGAPAAHGGLHG